MRIRTTKGVADCPTCSTQFEFQPDNQLAGFMTGKYVPSIRYCSIKCNTGLAELASKAKEAVCECGQEYVSYAEGDKCLTCRLPAGLQNALNKIENEYGVKA